MRRISGILATTHVDHHHEALALSALEGMVDQINRVYLPLGVEHDPRIPPIGRVVGAALHELDDGEVGLMGEIELFEPGDVVPIDNNNRRTRVRLRNSDAVAVIDDRSYFSSEDQSAIKELRTTLRAEAETESKKAFEPISVLTIAFALLASNIVGGFLQKIGSDAWDAAKPKLKHLFSRRRKSLVQLLNIALTVELAGELRLIEVIVTEPTESDIDLLEPDVFDQAVELAKRGVEKTPNLARFVFAFSTANGLVLQFAVTAIGCPVLFNAPQPPPFDLRHLSLGGPRGEVQDEPEDS